MVEYQQYPLVLAGPILRRTEPRSISVWLALSKPAKVSLFLWQGPINTGIGEKMFTGQDALHRSQVPVQTKRIGENLHIALVTLKIDEPDAPLFPDNIYSYNVNIAYQKDGKTATDDLKSLLLLLNGPLDGKPHLALGYDEGVLPSFALAPISLTDLNIIYGSCRRPHKGLSDGLAWVDDFIEKDRKDPIARPHQLLLGGDQIYADDVSNALMIMLMDTSKNLIGMIEDRTNVKHVTIQGVEHVTIQGTSYSVDEKRLPHGLRSSLILDEARMTTHDGQSHLMAFGEYCAMYLYVWSNACWPSVEDFPTIERLMNYHLTSEVPSALLGDIEKNILWKCHALGGMPDRVAERCIGKSLSKAERADLDEFIQREKRATAKSMKESIDDIKRFHSTLDRVRRAMANVPTYMMFDDHDVTDDWNLNTMWIDRVYTSPLGRSVVRNALTSYAVFQAWGNDPETFSTHPPNKRLLKLASEYFKPAPSPGAKLPLGPEAAAVTEIDTLIGLNEKKSSVKWHFEITGSRHKVLAIDNRTQRSYLSRIGPPGNLSKQAMLEQIPAGPLEPGLEVLILLAPLPVLGPPVFDELIGPLVYRVFDALSYSSLKKHEGTRGMAGTNPDAIEAWAFDAHTFEKLLKRLEPYRQVVILSGDVHYGSSQVMSYWSKGKPDPARFAQFTSSGLLNTMPPYIRTADRSLSFLQQMLRADIGAERIGWNKKDPPPLLIDEESIVVPALKSKLKESPVMIPTHGWPEETKFNADHPVDWSWRVTPVRDTRADRDRPEGAQPLELFNDPDQDIEMNPDGYRRVLRRHVGQLDKLNNSRQILFSNNLGVVRFNKQDGKLIAINDLYTVFPFDLPHYVKPELYTHHTVQLSGISEQRPEEKLAEGVGK